MPKGVLLCTEFMDSKALVDHTGIFYIVLCGSIQDIKNNYELFFCIIALFFNIL